MQTLYQSQLEEWMFNDPAAAQRRESKNIPYEGERSHGVFARP
jgi:hypothetical protein